MAATAAILFIAAVQIFCQCSLFIEPSNNSVEIAGATFIARIIFTVALLDLLYSTSIYPSCCNNVPRVSRVIAEILIATIMFEFAMNVVWNRLELITSELTRHASELLGVCCESYEEWYDVIMGGTTTVLSLIVLAHVLTVTNQLQVIPKNWIPEEQPIRNSIALSENSCT